MKSSVVSDHPAIATYDRIQHRYVNFAGELKRILEDSLDAAKLKFQSVDCRAKSTESFRDKCATRNLDGSLKYNNPLTQITDLAGVRVITFTLGDVQKVCQFLEHNFDIKERKDIGEERLLLGRPGYQSIHYLCELSKKRLELPEFSQFEGLICEIQVRTVLQHVWAQMEHGMQYKAGAALPTTIARKFLSLSGLLEIGDREFEAIEDEFYKLRDSVKSDFESDLTREAFNEKTGLTDLESNEGDKSLTQKALGVRSLVADGKYTEAIEVYNIKIAEQPNSLTLYLGRAKAKFLSGDIDGASKDIKAAEKLHPDNKAVLELREQIIEGKLAPPSSTSDLTAANNATNLGHEAMKQGDGELAYLHYSEALDLGASRPFSVLNRAMACALAGDFSGSTALLSSLQVRSGTPMEINILTMRVILKVLCGSIQIEQELDELKAVCQNKGDFSFKLSPLQLFHTGLANKGELNGKPLLGRVFSTIGG